MISRTENNYNATCEWFDSNDESVSLELVQVVDGKIYRACGHWSTNNGTAKFHAEWLGGKFSFQDHYQIHLDGGAKYKNSAAKIM